MKSFISATASLLVISILFTPQGHCTEQPDQNSIEALQKRCLFLEQHMKNLEERIDSLVQNPNVKNLTSKKTSSRPDEWVWRWPLYKLVTFLIITYYTNPQKISR